MHDIDGAYARLEEIGWGKGERNVSFGEREAALRNKRWQPYLSRSVIYPFQTVTWRSRRWETMVASENECHLLRGGLSEGGEGRGGPVACRLF